MRTGSRLQPAILGDLIASRTEQSSLLLHTSEYSRLVGHKWRQSLITSGAHALFSAELISTPPSVSARALNAKTCCPCRKSDPDIMVMQPAEDRRGYNSSDRMDGSGYRSVLDKGQMRSSDVVVFCIRAEHISQMSLAEDDDVIKALPSDRADQPFGMAVLPRRSRCCRSVANAHGANPPSERLAIDPIAITDKMLRRVLPADGLSHLPRDPFGRGMRSYPESEHATSFMTEDH
jgi:hypothetical protein